MSYLYDDLEEFEYNPDYFRPELDPKAYYMCPQTDSVFSGKEWLERWDECYEEDGDDYLKNLDDQGLDRENHGLVEVKKVKRQGKTEWVEVS